MIPQPKTISDYNQFMNGVDLHDQLRKRYACPSKKYWKYLLWYIVDCYRVNAYFVHKESIFIKDNEEKAIFLHWASGLYSGLNGISFDENLVERNQNKSYCFEYYSPHGI